MKTSLLSIFKPKGETLKDLPKVFIPIENCRVVVVIGHLDKISVLGAKVVCCIRKYIWNLVYIDVFIRKKLRREREKKKRERERGMIYLYSVAEWLPKICISFVVSLIIFKRKRKIVHDGRKKALDTYEKILQQKYVVSIIFSLLVCFIHGANLRICSRKYR